MASPAVTYTFSNATVADATQVNQNFTDIINGITDGTKDLSISALTVAGNFSATGTTSTIGNASSDDFVLTASLASTINIKTTATYGIGDSTHGLTGIYFGANSQTVRIVPSGSMSATWTFTFPVSAGTANNVLITDGSGVTSWTNPYALASANINTANADTTLTYSDKPMQMFTSFTASKTIQLPTTNVPAGYVITLINNSAYEMVVTASNTSALTVANSCNMDATVANGYVVLMALQATPTTPAHWRVVEVYEQYSFGANFNQGAGVSGSSTSKTMYALRKNNVVTLSSGYLAINPGTAASSYATATGEIPTRFRPVVDPTTTGYKYVSGSASGDAGPAHVLITSAGGITIYRTFDRATNWPVSSDTGVDYITISYRNN